MTKEKTVLGGLAKRKRGRPKSKTGDRATKSIRVGQRLYDYIAGIQENRKSDGLRHIPIDEIFQSMSWKAQMLDRFMGPDSADYLGSVELIREGFHQLVQQAEVGGSGCAADVLLSAFESALSQVNAKEKVDRQTIRSFTTNNLLSLKLVPKELLK